jgi:multidrug efflux system outer membrane protein
MNFALIKHRAGVSLFTSALLSLSACSSLAPDYSVPDDQAAGLYKEQNLTPPAGWKTAQPADQMPRGQWWQVFGDPLLSDLENQALSANQNLKQAAARVQEARAYHQGTESRRLPSIDAGFGPSRERDSHSSTDAAQPATTYWRAQMNVAYEADLFGRVSDAIKASGAEAEQSAALYQSVLLALQADVAVNYYQLRSLDAQLKVYDDTLKLRSDALAFARSRSENGQDSQLDLMRAQTELASTRADSLALARARAVSEHSLAVLLGQPPASFEFGANPIEAPAVQIPVGIPSDLLERRPDIAAAERAMAAANARIGVAKAAYYPSLSLTGTAGYEGNTLSELFQGSSKALLLGPLTGTLLHLPLFDGGKRNADLENARAAYQEQVAHYRQTVLNALLEVEDNLAGVRLLEQQTQAESQAAEASRGASRITQAQYHEGATDYLSVLDANRSTLQAARSLAGLYGEQSIAAVRLIRALGGGWGNTTTKAAAVQ